MPIPEPPDRPEPTASQKFGLTVTTLTPALAGKAGYEAGKRGVLVTDVAPGSDA